MSPADNDTTTVTSRRRLLTGFGSAAVAGLAGCSATRQGEGGTPTTQDGGTTTMQGGGRPYYPHTIWGMFGSWENAYVSGGRFYARDHDFRFQNFNSLMEPSRQVSHINRFTQQNVDGILVGPVSATAIAGAIEKANNQGIPVVACNSDVETSALAMSVYIGNQPACRQLGEEIVTYLREEVSPTGTVEGTVLDLQGDLATSNGKNREQGFRNAIKGHDGINVIAQRANFKASPAQQKTYNVLQSKSGNIDAIFAANGGMALGASNALERYGKKPGDVFMACMDASPTVIDLFKQGWVQRSFSQPTQYYLPIAMHYVDQARRKGVDSLPDPGTKITTDDLKITGKKHLGVNLWAGQAWAPAQIKEKFGHRWFQTNGKLITPDNYDDPSNWGVIFGKAEV